MIKDLTILSETNPVTEILLLLLLELRNLWLASGGLVLRGWVWGLECDLWAINVKKWFRTPWEKFLHCESEKPIDWRRFKEQTQNEVLAHRSHCEKLFWKRARYWDSLVKTWLEDLRNKHRWRLCHTGAIVRCYSETEQDIEIHWVKLG